MVKIVCELCGSNKLVKDGEYFVCQSCETKYTTEQARNLIVEGTVKIDHSDEIEKILKNADNTFSDGNYAEAFSLYSKVLNEAPDNAHAVLYRAICSGWQSTSNNCNLSELNNAISRALKIKHSQCGDTKEYFSFANDLIIECNEVIFAIKNMYISYYNNNQTAGFGLIGVISAAEQNSKLKDFMQNGVKDCCTVICNIVDNIFNPVEDYGNSMELLYENAKKIIKNAKIYRDNALLNEDKKLDNYLAMINNLKDKAIPCIEKRKLEKREEYWFEHFEEKEELENEIIQLKRKIKMDKQELERIPEVISIIKLKTDVKAIEQEYANLSVFKTKEKKALKEKMDNINKTIDSLKSSIEPLLSQKKEKMENAKKRIEEIQTEFIKDR